MFAINTNLFQPSTGGIKLLIVLCFENNFIVNLYCQSFHLNSDAILNLGCRLRDDKLLK